MIIENKDIFRGFLKDFIAEKDILVDIGKYLFGKKIKIILNKKGNL